MTDPMSRLREWPHIVAPPLPFIDTSGTLWGIRPPCRWIATEDADGQVEVSLTLDGLKLPTDAHVAAFFRALGVEPVTEETPPGSVARHFILKVGGPMQ